MGGSIVFKFLAPFDPSRCPRFWARVPGVFFFGSKRCKTDPKKGRGRTRMAPTSGHPGGGGRSQPSFFSASKTFFAVLQRRRAAFRSFFFLQKVLVVSPPPKK